MAGSCMCKSRCNTQNVRKKKQYKTVECNGGMFVNHCMPSSFALLGHELHTYVLHDNFACVYVAINIIASLQD